MADVTVICSACEKTFSVSEFADPDKVRCPLCGAPVKRSLVGHAAVRKGSGGLRLKAVEPSEPKPVATASDAEPTQSDLMQNAFGPNRQVTQSRRFGPDRQQKLMAWLMFALTAAVFYRLRYGDLLPAEWLDYLRDYGWILVVVAWFATFTIGFSESLMQGVLCLLIPGYFLYFLLLTDRVYLRAVTYGMLVGVGPDTWSLLRERWFQFYAAAMEWILSGGGA